MNWIELLGYLGSVLIAVSLTMKSMVKLRWINLFGAATFAFYGYVIGAYPVLALNGFIALVDVFYIVQMYYRRDWFDIFPIRSLESAFLQRFLAFHRDDIVHFFPDAEITTLRDPLAFFITRNMLPVGLFIGEKRGEGVLKVVLEYAIPDYRDLKNGFYLFDDAAGNFRREGIRTLRAHSTVPEHVRYLRKVGFQPDPDRGDGHFVRSLT